VHRGAGNQLMMQTIGPCLVMIVVHLDSVLPYLQKNLPNQSMLLPLQRASKRIIEVKSIPWNIIKISTQHMHRRIRTKHSSYTTPRGCVDCWTMLYMLCILWIMEECNGGRALEDCFISYTSMHIIITHY